MFTLKIKCNIAKRHVTSGSRKYWSAVSRRGNKATKVIKKKRSAGQSLVGNKFFERGTLPRNAVKTGLRY